jgi:hypothetical protein
VKLVPSGVSGEGLARVESLSETIVIALFGSAPREEVVPPTAA